MNSFLANQIGLPWIFTLFVILPEFLGSLVLIVGAFTRFSAIGIAMVMSGAVTVVHLKNGIFMNWGGSQAGEGYEYHLLVIGGAGRASVDRLVAERF